MGLLYAVVSNFGWAVVIFTLLVKTASFPLSLKQQKNMAISQLFTPRVQEIQKKYRGNQAKMQEEMGKLQKEGYNPMGGCGPMILMMIILFGVIDVVYKPMTHMERFDRDDIAMVQRYAREVEYTSIILGNEDDLQLFLDYREIDAPRALSNTDGGISNEQRREIGEYIQKADIAALSAEIGFSDETRRDLRGVAGQYGSLRGELRALAQYTQHREAFPITEKLHGELAALQKNMVFLRMDLGQTPSFGNPNRLWFIVAACFTFSVVQMIIQQFIQKKNMEGVKGNNPANNNQMKMLMVMGPMFSLFISFAVPAGAGLYWTVSYIFTIGQSLLIYKIWPPERMRAEARERMRLKFGAIEATAKIVDVDDEGNETVKEEKLSEMSKREQDDYFKKKLEAARKADLEKYGEVPDVDLSQYDKPVEPEIIEDSEEETDGKEV